MHQSLTCRLCGTPRPGSGCPRPRRRSSPPAASSWRSRLRRRPARRPAAPHEETVCQACAASPSRVASVAPCCCSQAGPITWGPSRPSLALCTLPPVCLSSCAPSSLNACLARFLCIRCTRCTLATPGLGNTGSRRLLPPLSVSSLLPFALPFRTTFLTCVMLTPALDVGVASQNRPLLPTIEKGRVGGFFRLRPVVRRSACKLRRGMQQW